MSESGGSFPLDKDTLTAAGAAAEEKHLSETSFRCPFDGHRCHIDSRRRGRKPGGRYWGICCWGFYCRAVSSPCDRGWPREIHNIQIVKRGEFSQSQSLVLRGWVVNIPFNTRFNGIRETTEGGGGKGMEQSEEQEAEEDCGAERQMAR